MALAPCKETTLQTPTEMPENFLRAAAGAAGFGALAWGAALAAKRRLGASFPALAALFAAGAAFLACAFSDGAAEALLHPTHMGRIRLGVGAVAALALLVTFEGIRRTQLKERYALLWFFPLLLTLLLTVWTAPMRFLRARFGMEYSSTMAAVVMLSLMVAVFVLAKNLSKAERDIAAVAQKCALLAAELEENKKPPASADPPPAAGGSGSAS